MPVLSYLAIPVSGAKSDLLEALNSMQFCEAFPADNQDILVLVTDTPDDTTEKSLQGQLRNLPSLQSLCMTFGCNDEQPLGEGEGYEDR